MIGKDDASMAGSAGLRYRARVWLFLSVAAGLLALAGSLVGLLQPSIYAQLTPAFLPQALAQDLANLVLMSPGMIILAFLALRGSQRAFLVWLGFVTFTVYNYVIYTFSIPFGPLFLLWVGVLGLSIYALVGGLVVAPVLEIQRGFRRDGPIRVMGGLLLAAALLFAALWLSEDIPALLAGVAPQSVSDMNLPTNPVHILDLAFFLPAALLAGISLLRGRPLGYTLAPGMVVFLVLTGIPILLTPVVQSFIGQTPAWEVGLPIGTLTLSLSAILIWALGTWKQAPQS